MKWCYGLLLFSLVHVHPALLLLQQNKITIRYFGPCLRTQTGKTKSGKSACADVGNCQREDTLKVVRIAAPLRNLTSCCKSTFHKALSKGKDTGLKYRFESESMDLLTVMPAIAIPTIPTKCRLASITFWISTRQFY